MRILVDRLIYQGFRPTQADTPPVIRLYARFPQDHDEKAHCQVIAVRDLTGRTAGQSVGIWDDLCQRVPNRQKPSGWIRCRISSEVLAPGESAWAGEVFLRLCGVAV